MIHLTTGCLFQVFILMLVAPVTVTDSECVLVNMDCNQSSDPGLWLQPFSSELVDFWIEKGPIACQNNDGRSLEKRWEKGRDINFSQGPPKSNPALFFMVIAANCNEL
jgi:hypothetical protein